MHMCGVNEVLVKKQQQRPQKYSQKRHEWPSYLSIVGCRHYLSASYSFLPTDFFNVPSSCTNTLRTISNGNSIFLEFYFPMDLKKISLAAIINSKVSLFCEIGLICSKFVLIVFDIVHQC